MKKIIFFASLVLVFASCKLNESESIIQPSLSSNRTTGVSLIDGFLACDTVESFINLNGINLDSAIGYLSEINSNNHSKVYVIDSLKAPNGDFIRIFLACDSSETLIIPHMVNWYYRHDSIFAYSKPMFSEVTSSIACPISMVNGDVPLSPNCLETTDNFGGCMQCLYNEISGDWVYGFWCMVFMEECVISATLMCGIDVILVQGPIIQNGGLTSGENLEMLQGYFPFSIFDNSNNLYIVN